MQMIRNINKGNTTRMKVRELRGKSKQHNTELNAPTIKSLKIVVFWDVTPCGSWKIDVSEERIASIIRVERIGELGITLVVSSNRSALRRNTCHPDDKGNTFLRNVGPYKSHTA
jgi:hypothetical protein